MVNQEKLRELDSHWNEVMCLAQKYGFIGQEVNGTAILLTHRNQLETVGEEKYIYSQMKLFEIDMRKLRICYLSDIPDRVQNFKKKLLDSVAGEVAETTQRGFVTEAAEYIFADCKHSESYMGLSVDQVILDYRNPMIGIAKCITTKSRLPEKERLIDDRTIGTSDT